MGICLEPAPAMGRWRVEVRTESAYLVAKAPGGGAEGTVRIADGAVRGFAIPLAEIGMVRAAVEQIRTHNVFRLWMDVHRHRVVSDCWRVEESGDWCQLQGPAFVYGDSIELGYRELSSLALSLDLAMRRA